MPLTPEDVSSKRFTPVRLREGYEMGEVDQFLDEVEAELQRLIRENEDLRQQVEAAGGDAASKDDSAHAEEEPEESAQVEESPKADESQEAEAEEVTQHKDESSEASAKADQGEARVLEEIVVTTSSEASKAASRLLELATNNAELLVDEAREEAESILTEARDEAEEITSNAERRKNSLDEETERRREELTASMEEEQAELSQKISTLREFEQSYRTNLKNYFAEQLQQIEQAEIEPQGGEAVAVDERASAAGEGEGATAVEVETNPHG